MKTGTGSYGGSAITVAPTTDPYGLAIDSSYFSFTQSTPATTWTVNHNIGRIPFVTILDANNNEIVPQSTKLTNLTAIITFASPTAGKCVCASIGSEYVDQQQMVVNPTDTSKLPDGTIVLRTM